MKRLPSGIEEDGDDLVSVFVEPQAVATMDKHRNARSCFGRLNFLSLAIDLFLHRYLSLFSSVRVIDVHVHVSENITDGMETHVMIVIAAPPEYAGRLD